ncbi:MAG: JAB domain-containing protein, partial [Ezakiella massiliensis]
MKFTDFSDILKEDAENLDIEITKDDSLLPREKLLENGVQDLRDEELLAILIGTGSQKHSVFDLANMLYEMNGRSLRKVVSMSQKDLAKIRGIGPAKLATLMASFELSKRVYQEEIKVDIERFVTTKRVGSYLVSKLSHYNEEHFFVLLLNNKNEEIDSLIRKDQELFKLSSEEAFGEFFKEEKVYKYIGEDEISKGTVNQTIAMPREVFRKAIDLGASSIILAHNHPSGDVRPSMDDINLTRRMADAGKILGINVLDHFVVGHNSY